MRLVTFEHTGTTKVGVRQGDNLIDLSVIAPHVPMDLKSILAAQISMAEIANCVQNVPDTAIYNMDDVRLLPPIPNPDKILCIGRNYVAHAIEGGAKPPTYPEVFVRTAQSLIAHGDAIIRPQISDKLDFECEIAMIIGKTAYQVKVENALEYIAGYSLFNDVTLRDYQRKSTQWTMGKNFDNTGPFGPDFISADELPDGVKGLHILTRLNGHIMQDANTDDFIFPVPKLIEILTECMTLVPGDVIITGTPAGVGYARTPPVFMKHGDVIEVEVAKMGVLTNMVQDDISVRYG